MTSPSVTRSHLHCSIGLISSIFVFSKILDQVDGFRYQLSDKLEITRIDQLGLNHPASSAGEHPVESQISSKIFGINSTSRDETHTPIGSRDRLEELDSTHRFSRKELQDINPMRQCQLDLRWSADTRKDRH